MYNNPGEKIINIVKVNKEEFMTFTKDGKIDIFSVISLKQATSSTIFNIGNEDYQSMLLIKSKEYVLFTMEK
jgi:hypothetical protein